MKYKCQVEINADLDKLISLFLEKMVEGKDLTPGSQYTFSYDLGNNNKMVMTETIESVNLPHEIVTIYEVDQVFNRCINQFKESDNKVIYTMEVEFIFEDETGISQEDFYNKTQGQMDEFKKHVESTYKESILD